MRLCGGNLSMGSNSRFARLAVFATLIQKSIAATCIGTIPSTSLYSTRRCILVRYLAKLILSHHVPEIIRWGIKQDKRCHQRHNVQPTIRFLKTVSNTRGYVQVFVRNIPFSEQVINALNIRYERKA